MEPAVYIHFPYCLHKCPYCDFNTYAVRTFPEKRYAEALIRELDAAAASRRWSDRRAGTIFFGGGTPSLLEPSTVGALIERIDERLGLADDCEITLEANPGSLEGSAAARLGEFRAAGINRVSFGVQSFDSRSLEVLGRIHDGAASLAAVGAAREAGFQNLSCDLMVAVPGQTLEQWQRDVDALIDLRPDHVSTYNLTYESGTALTGMRDVGRVEPAPEETERLMYEAAIEKLADAGYRHYEISNFARPAHEARHNLAYWSWSDYIGLGAGAHGFASGDGHGRDGWGYRYSNEKLPETYMSADTDAWAATSETLDEDMAISEFIMLGLRLLDGFECARFESLFGGGFAEKVEPYAALEAAGMVHERGGRIRLTDDGLMVADSVIMKLACR